MRFVINSAQKVNDICEHLQEEFITHKWLQVSVIAGTRTLKQNNWIYQAYKMLAIQGDQTELEYKAYCKYALGLPILMDLFPDEADYTRDMLQSISYENRLKFILNYPVTSRFTLKPCAQYIDEITNHYNGYELPRKDWK